MSGELRERLLRVRAQYGVSQEQIAAAAGVTRNTISNIERAAKTTNERTRYSVGAALDAIEAERGRAAAHRDNASLYARTVTDWRTALDAVRRAGAPVVTLPVTDLAMILDCCVPPGGAS